MKLAEFAQIIAYIAAAVGKRLEADSVEVYYDLLGDLPEEVLQIAAKRVVLQHKWATFPSVAELREAATETIFGRVKSLSAGEAWSLVWAAIGKIDPEIDGSSERHIKALPESVREAVRAMGIHAMCYGCEPVGVVRGQFMKIYEQIAERTFREALLPAPVKKAIGRIGGLPQLTKEIGLER